MSQKMGNVYPPRKVFASVFKNPQLRFLAKDVSNGEVLAEIREKMASCKVGFGRAPRVFWGVPGVFQGFLVVFCCILGFVLGVF